jgi:hypothetical protein
MRALDATDYADRKRRINSGTVSARVRYAGLDEQTGFATFEWGGRTLVLINPAILP